MWTDVDPELRRSRHEVLADVRRRGDRIRRRRRTLTGLAGALAVVVPVLALVSFGAGVDRTVRVSVAGPVPTATVPTALSAAVGDGEVSAVTPPTALGHATGEPMGPRPSWPKTLRGGATNPEATTVVTSRADIDDPTIASGATGRATNALSPTVAGSSRSPVNSPAEAAVAPCPPSGVRITVDIEKPAYSPGEWVRFTSTLVNTSGTTCAVQGRPLFHVEDAAGAIVGSFPHTADYQVPTEAGPGWTFISSLSWDQTTCAAGPCAQVPAGAYTVVAEWAGAPYVGRGAFTIGS